MRARQPDRSGVIVREGIRSAYDVYGDGNAPTVLLLPTWSVADARHWKFQVPVLARRYQVITMDGRGNGRSDRPLDPAAYSEHEYVADALAVLDEEDVERAVVVGLSLGGYRATVFAATHPERTLGAVMIGPSIAWLAPPDPAREAHDFFADYGDAGGWALYSAAAWRRDFRRFAEFFWGQIFPEPHSTKGWEDGVEWQLDTDAETLIASTLGAYSYANRDEFLAELAQITCPVLVIHGTDDKISPLGTGEALAEYTGGDLMIIDGGGHCPQARDPIAVNRALMEFVDRCTPPRARTPRRATWTRALARPRRLLYLSSPIGLGHARRDLAIAQQLRELQPNLRIEWLAQHPVTAFLDVAGESVHPASRHLASESRHIETEAGEHDLHAFQAIRQMDEILVANFSLLQDVLDSGDYDVVVGDEAWDLDHFWHENPELKRAAYAWMTDFVGWLPMPEGGEYEAMIAADCNAEMIELVERFTRVRDRSIFVGEPDDIVPDTFGPGLPAIRDWTERHYDFSGYITGLGSDVFDERVAVRRRLGYDAERPLIVVSVGGSGVGTALLRKVIDTYPRLRKEIDGLHMVVVAGPRVEVSALPTHDGVDVRGFMPDLPLHLAACDAAIVQGGLTTTMELVALGRPFVYFPLGHHFEQQRHVRHRLERHGAGRCLDYGSTDGDDIAAALVEQLGATPSYRPVPGDGAARAAALIADLL